MKTLFISAVCTFFFLISTTARTPVPAWGQCGGIGWTGGTVCVSGYKCTKVNDFFWNCQPA
jgi:hypothetical protein